MLHGKRKISRTRQKNAANSSACPMFNVRAWHIFFSLYICVWPSNVNSNKFLYENFSKLNQTIYKRSFKAKWREKEQGQTEQTDVEKEIFAFGVLHALWSSLFFTEFMFVFVHDQWPHHTVFIKHLFLMFRAHHIAVCTNISPDAPNFLYAQSKLKYLNFMINYFT